MTSAIVLGYLVIINLVTFSLYSADKFAAVRGYGERRIAESTLHLYGLLGGWPGALIARRILRHKTRKPAFVFMFRVVVTANIAACALLLTLVV